MSSEISVRDQIFSTYDSLYDAEKKVADYLISHPSEAIEMSVSELAQHCEASQATIVRFCKKIGCKGFHQLKIRMAGEQREQEEQVISNEINLDHMEQSLNNILGSKLEELKATYSNFDPKELREIIDKILQADMIEFAAMGNTIPIALDGTYKFNQLGIKAVSSTIWESQEAFSRILKEKDMLFAISASGASKRLLNMVEIAKENQAVTVAITNQAKSPLAEACDYVLLTATREHIFHDQVSFTRMAAMSVIDCLFLFLFSTKWDSFKNVAEHEQSVAEEKM
ncbi:MAG TPA: MurR/RpiR family transcriptional regulator [Candidatus Anaerostipes avistercoris]|uniref:MurR/RpiR family transcriptional regulator n=1 Tax=Candidatus Anaerostipes avistercoris TaxID=2838462 RepID=A0A9D2TA79_9FIRM|nr:MurR/RpiR family transcriptional regulator [uncultured Anaerostipes sp.]HJC51374.1 MurR/RpiR family transcriptional regulator [Candidatus Anaerostipes avistercoris]